MKTSRLLFATILGLVLMVPPAYSQKVQDQIMDLTRDTLSLKAAVKLLQESSDQKNAEIMRLLQEVLGNFAAVNQNVDRLSATMGTLKADNEASAKNLQAARAELDELKKNVDQGFVSLNNQVRSLSTGLSDLQSREQPVATAADLYNRAWGEYNQGFYDFAVGDFREFIRNYPADSVRAAQASYYIGESLFAQGKFDQAITEFDLNLATYPNSDRKCSALYKKGLTHIQLKDSPKAKEALQRVVAECANTQEATNAAAELKKVK